MRSANYNQSICIFKGGNQDLKNWQCCATGTDIFVLAKETHWRCRTCTASVPNSWSSGHPSLAWKLMPAQWMLGRSGGSAKWWLCLLSFAWHVLTWSKRLSPSFLYVASFLSFVSLAAFLFLPISSPCLSYSSYSSYSTPWNLLKFMQPLPDYWDSQLRVILVLSPRKSSTHLQHQSLRRNRTDKAKKRSPSKAACTEAISSSQCQRGPRSAAVSWSYRTR